MTELIVFCTIAGLATNAIAGSPAFDSPNYPLTEVNAVELALRQNPTILFQVEEIKRNQGLVLQAQAALLPQLQRTGTYSREEPSLVTYRSGSTSSNVDALIAPVNHPAGLNPSTSTTLVLTPASGQSYIGVYKNWTLQITITQLLWDGGAALANRREARFNEEAAYYTLRNAIDNVVDTVRIQFYQILLDRALVQVQEEAVNLLRSELDDQRERFDAGTATHFDVLQAQTQLQNQISRLLAAQRNYLLAQATLVKLLGIPAGRQYSSEEPLPVSGSLDVEPFEVDLEKALAVARARRPLLKADQRNVSAAIANGSAAKAGFQPIISASAGLQSESEPHRNDLQDVVNGWQLGGSGQWNIVDGGTTYGKVKVANSQIEEEEIALNDAQRQVELDVFTAIGNLHRAQESMIAARKGIEVSLRSFHMAYQRRSEGKGSQLDVFDARNQLTLARSTFLRSEYQCMSAIAQYQYVTGTEATYNDAFDQCGIHPKTLPKW